MRHARLTSVQKIQQSRKLNASPSPSKPAPHIHPLSPLPPSYQSPLAPFPTPSRAGRRERRTRTRSIPRATYSDSSGSCPLLLQPSFPLPSPSALPHPAPQSSPLHAPTPPPHPPFPPAPLTFKDALHAPQSKSFGKRGRGSGGGGKGPCSQGLCPLPRILLTLPPLPLLTRLSPRGRGR